MSGIDDTAASDIPKGGWVDRLLPAAARPYARLARLDRPIGTWLLLFPCWWSIAFASPRPLSPESLILFATFGIGALTMRGAGCTFNDICDRDFDAQVARTRDRPLPSGQVTVRGAAVFLVALLALGLAILLTLNPFAIAVGVASLVLVFAYPLSKRVTYWPQFVLGLAFNWGALLGWAAVRGGDLAGAGPALCRGHILDARLRHDLRASGSPRRPRGRGQVDGAAPRPRQQAVALRVLPDRRRLFRRDRPRRRAGMDLLRGSRPGDPAIRLAGGRCGPRRAQGLSRQVPLEPAGGVAHPGVHRHRPACAVSAASASAISSGRFTLKNGSTGTAENSAWASR